MNLADIGEDQLVGSLLSTLVPNKHIVIPPGDDCAVVECGLPDRLLLLKTDCVVSGIHFRADARPGDVGWKAMARPLSDFAAMAALPQFAVVTLIAPEATPVAWVRRMYRGMQKAAQKFAVAIVGGETSNSRGPLAISVAITGIVERDRYVTRSGGRAGDVLFVTGRLGGSGRGKHLRFLPRIDEARWLTKRFEIHAMMDLSDGLGADLPRLARASGLSFQIEEATLPRNRDCTIHQAIGDGEDYELLFALAPNESARLERAWQQRFPKLPLTAIGRLTESGAAKTRKLPRGYVHFQQR